MLLRPCQRMSLETVKKYSAKSRHYHDMNHICGMCDCWDLFKHKLKNPDEIFMAIIYHDIIYKPTRSDNEEKSAETGYQGTFPEGGSLYNAILDCFRYDF